LKNKIINLLFIIDGLRPGGKERQLVEIIKNIDATQFKIGVITFNSDQHYSQLVREYTSFYKELKKRPTRLEPLFSIWACFKYFKPDIVHTWDAISSFYSFLPCKYYNIPVINGSVRDAGIDKGLTYHFKRFFLQRADFVLGNSEAGLTVYKIKGKVIYNIINTSRFLSSKATDEFNLLMTANFSDYKDQETFLKAAVELVKDKTVNEVYLLGDGPHKKMYIDWIASEFALIKDHFHFPGAISNIEEYLSKCKVGVLCSTPIYSEGLSNSVLEYMAAGLISIVTDLGGSNEIIEDDKNGYLIQPGDFKKIIELVHHVKNDLPLQQNIIKQAKKTIENKFSMEKNLEILCQVYKNCNR
jgi:glycosyltransferase involved in cell wall biosynthesis